MPVNQVQERDETICQLRDDLKVARLERNIALAYGP
jgi:hypothetical protein